jgi:uncharacterized membrane protein affecting hemolysin expression
MPVNDLASFHQPRRSKSHTASLALLFLGMSVALAGNVYQFVRGEHMKRDLATMQKNTQTQIAKLTDVSAAMLEENRQRFEAIKNQLQEATAASLRQSRSEVRRTSSQQLAQPQDRYTLDLYVPGSPQPHKIVVNEVKKNGLVGYLATPKVRVAGGQTSQ